VKALPAFAKRDLDERQTAARALLTGHLLPVDHQAFPLVRRHADALRREFADLCGYDLQVTSDYARLYKRVDPGAARPLPMPAVTKHERQHDAIDDRKVLDRQRIVFIALTCAVLERTAARQIPIGDLAERFQRTGAAQQITIDWTVAATRGLLTDAIEWLLSLGVITEHAGSTDAFRHRDDTDEALYDISRKRLAALLADPLRMRSTATAAQLADDAGRYAPTDEGANLRIRHRLARMLIENPVLYLDDLTETERVYFLSQRARLESGVSHLLGMQAERRADGTAMVVRDRELTDRPFPARSNRKQITLLLCRALAENPTGILALGSAREHVRDLLVEHGERWSLHPDNPDDVTAATEEALTLLDELDLVWFDADEITVRPALHRFRDPLTTTPESRP
jgi:uncharacterized protein (TIGR02678 family)